VDGWKRGLDLDWAFDLVSPDPVRRARARGRHAETLAACQTAQERINELWRRTGTLSPTEPGLAAEMDQRVSASQDASQYLLSQPISDFVDRREVATLPYALLLLEWEARYPEEWPRWWGTKKKVLRAFCQVPEYSPEVRARLTALMVLAVCREHRCEDGGYARLGRYLADDDLTGYLWTIGETASRDAIRRRAAFVVYLIREPHVPATRASWATWLRTQAG
jgi:hypothetical protein